MPCLGFGDRPGREQAWVLSSCCGGSDTAFSTSPGCLGGGQGACSCPARPSPALRPPSGGHTPALKPQFPSVKETQGSTCCSGLEAVR